MADDVLLNVGTGGDTIAADDIAGVKHQRVKIEYGTDGVATEVSTSNPLPIGDAGGSLTVDNAGTFLVQNNAAIPAGTNGIGKLTANSGVNIGEVDVTSVVSGTSATSLGKARNGPAGGTDTGVAAWAIRDDTLAALAEAEDDYTPLRVDANGALHVTSGSTTGATPYRNIDVDESEDQVKGSAGTVFFIHCMNLSASKMYLKLYDLLAASVTVSSTTPTLEFPLPTQGDTNGSGFVLAIPDGIAFSTGITVAATTVLGPSAGAPGTNEIILNLGYK